MIRAHPSLLLSGIIGFALRGGIVLLTVPIVVLPTAVEVRFLLGGGLSSTGLTPGFFEAIALLTLLAVTLALAALYALARCEIAQFSRFVHYADRSDSHPWLPPSPLAAPARRSLVRREYVVQAVALLAVLAAVVPLAAAVGQATLSEIILPSSSNSIYSRILGDVMTPVVAFGAALVGVEGVSAIATRVLLARAYGLRGRMSVTRHLPREIAVAVAGWLLFFAGVLVSVAVLALAWDAVRSVFLSSGLAGGLLDIVSALLVALLFGAVYTGALLLCGFVSAVRAGLWTFASLR